MPFLCCHPGRGLPPPSSTLRAGLGTVESLVSLQKTPVASEPRSPERVPQVAEGPLGLPGRKDCPGNVLTDASLPSSALAGTDPKCRGRAGQAGQSGVRAGGMFLACCHQGNVSGCRVCAQGRRVLPQGAWPGPP
ncbi:hypothetical protein H8959_015996 [Pygathrix nigripes]